jgi:hypothetical protein
VVCVDWGPTVVSSRCRTDRTFVRPRRTRALAVPKGIASRSLISRAVQPVGLVGDACRVLWHRTVRRLIQEDRGLEVNWLSLCSPERVHGQVSCDREHPGGHRTAARVVGVSLTPCPDQRLLGDLLGLGRIPRDASGQPVDTALIPPHKRLRRTWVPLAKSGQQSLFRGAVGGPGARRGRSVGGGVHRCPQFQTASIVTR